MKELIESYFAGKLTDEEKRDLLKQVESDEELQAEFTQYQNAQALLSFSDMVIDQEDSKRGYHSLMRKKKQQRLRHILLKTTTYAAAIVLLVVSVHLFYRDRYAVGQPAPMTLYVPPGQRISITLQDGTVVWLNAQTKLTYPTVFQKNERHVEVEGEAYFEVAKDQKRPFIVSTQNVDMKVLGTSFNVRSYLQEGFINTGLVEGELLVYFRGDKQHGVTLHANDQVVIRKSDMQVSAITHADHFLWKDGIYSFDSESLTSLLTKLEIYFDAKISVDDPADFQGKYTGKLRQQDGIDEILRVIQRIHKFKIEKDKETNIYYLKKTTQMHGKK